MQSINFARIYSYFCRKLPWKRYDEQQEKSFWSFGFALVSNPLNDPGMTACNFLHLRVHSARPVGRQYLLNYTLCLKKSPSLNCL